MTIPKYTFIYGVPMGEDELIVLFNYFNSSANSHVNQYYMSNVQHFRNVTTERIVNDGFGGLHESNNMETSVDNGKEEEEDTLDYSDDFYMLLDELQSDLEVLGFESDITNKMVDGKRVWVMVVGKIVKSISTQFSDYTTPYISKIETPMLFSLFPWIRTVFSAELADSLTSKYGLYLTAAHQ
jgi:hypothetical protein